MTAGYWIKLYLDILDDYKVARWPDWLFRRFIMFLLAAKEYDHDGYLQPVPDLAYRLRLEEKQVGEALEALSAAGVVRKDAQGWLIVNFSKRQGAVPGAERTRRSRKAGVTNRYTEEKREDTEGDTEEIQKRGAAAGAYRAYSQEIGPLTALVSDSIGEAVDEYGSEWVIAAIKESALNNKRNWKYAEAILKRWKAEGFQSNTARSSKNGHNKAETKNIFEMERARLRAEGKA